MGILVALSVFLLSFPRPGSRGRQIKQQRESLHFLLWTCSTEKKKLCGTEKKKRNHCEHVARRKKKRNWWLHTFSFCKYYCEHTVRRKDVEKLSFYKRLSIFLVLEHPLLICELLTLPLLNVEPQHLELLAALAIGDPLPRLSLEPAHQAAVPVQESNPGTPASTPAPNAPMVI